jgi:hypothetical protein
MMTDPVFGNLEYEYGWNGTVEIDCFGKMEEIGKYYISLRKELGYDENGMGIRFLNEKIDETGYQDIMF